MDLEKRMRLAEEWETGPLLADIISESICHLSLTPVVRALVVGNVTSAVRGALLKLDGGPVSTIRDIRNNYHRGASL
jgi:hypothetical protein